MEPQPHSAEYISDTRFGWWNDDFVRLLVARAAGGRKVERLADFGVGEGHWSLTLARALPDLEHVAGIDREPEWCKRSAGKYARLQTALRYEPILADVAATPLPSGSFDLATAQTLLMHSTAPERIVQEMARVVRPGGTVLCVEPINIANHAMLTQLEPYCSPVERAEIFRIWLVYYKHIKHILGDYDIGGRLPDLLAGAGLVNIRTYMNDKVEVSAAADFNLDHLAEEIGNPRVSDGLRAAGIGPGDFSLMHEIIGRVGNAMPPPFASALSASPIIICMGDRPAL